MNFEDERYVRLYTRDTTTWKLWSWQARFVFMSLIRKVDRAGILEVGDDGVEGLAAVLEIPLDIVELGLAIITKKNSKGEATVEWSEGRIGIPNFIPAQECRSTDAKRARDYRERMKVTKPVTEASPVVTDESRNVTEPSHGVTTRHTPSLRTVPSGTVPAVPSRTVPTDIPEVVVGLVLGAEPAEPTKKSHKPAIAVYTDRAFEIWKTAWQRRTGKTKRTQLMPDEAKRLHQLFMAKVPLARIWRASLGIHDSTFHTGDNDRSEKYMRFFHALSPSKFDELDELGGVYLALEQAKAAQAALPPPEPVGSDALRKAREQIAAQNREADELASLSAAAGSVP